MLKMFGLIWANICLGANSRLHKLQQSFIFQQYFQHFDFNNFENNVG